MSIHLVKGVGEASTPIAAFDAALQEAGIANFNLLVLSSVIPPGALVVDSPFRGSCDAMWGDRMFLVMAEQREVSRGVEAWAGLGWVQDEETGAGLFVEHHGASRALVEGGIEASLGSMVKSRPLCFGPPHISLAGATCDDRPVCALVAAVYETVGWTKGQR